MEPVGQCVLWGSSQAASFCLVPSPAFSSAGNTGQHSEKNTNTGTIRADKEQYNIMPSVPHSFLKMGILHVDFNKILEARKYNTSGTTTTES
jgi:hypothetical protein